MVCVGKLHSCLLKWLSTAAQHKSRLSSSFGLFQVYIHVFSGSFTDVFNKQAHTEQLNQFTKIFLAHEVTFLKEVLDKSGSVNDAVAVIVGDQEISCSTDGMWIQIKILH